MDNRLRDPRAKADFQSLLNNIIPNELQQNLPGSLRLEQIKSKIAHLAFRALIENYPESVWEGDGIRTKLGYGAEF